MQGIAGIVARPVQWPRHACTRRAEGVAMRAARSTPPRPNRQQGGKVLQRGLPPGFGLPSPPPVAGDLADVLLGLGAQMDDGIAVTFGNDDAAARALESGAVLISRNHTVFRVSGPGRVALLQAQCTADMESIPAGRGVATAFLDATGDVVDTATCIVLKTSILLLCSPGASETLLATLGPATTAAGLAVSVEDVSARVKPITLAGPGAAAIAARLRIDALAGLPPGTHALLSLQGAAVIALAGTGLGTIPGATFLADEAAAGDLAIALASAGAVPMGHTAWTHARVGAGQPAFGAEMGPGAAGRAGPLALGLGAAITAGRVIHRDDASSSVLCGLDIDLGTAPAPAPGARVLTQAGSDVGVMTSIAPPPARLVPGTPPPPGPAGACLALALVSPGHAPGSQLIVAGLPASVRDLPGAVWEPQEGPLSSLSEAAALAERTAKQALMDAVNAKLQSHLAAERRGGAPTTG